MKPTDFLVVGSGIAGLVYALEAAKLGTVRVLCKSDPIEGNTRYAQGGIASVMSGRDSFDAHIEDTIVAGAGLCDPEAVELVICNGPRCIEHLIALGTKFDRSVDSDSYELAQEGGHSARRILHSKDATGAEILRAIYESAKSHPNIEILSDWVAIDLFCESTDTNHRVRGLYALEKPSGKIHALASRIVFLATGGVGKVYLYTSNPDIATGDGMAMAYRAGASIRNMEFIQFHPTCLYHPQAKSFLLTEALRGEGAVLRDVRGYRFMPDYHPQAELAPRDIVARAIDSHMKKTGDDYVLLDITEKDPAFVSERFPNITARLNTFGFDITREPIPVVPAAHYACGGVLTDDFGRTDIENLFAAGEVACSGLHGANRLASNSLLEAVCYALRAAELTRDIFPTLAPSAPIPEWDPVGTTTSNEEVLISYAWDEVRRLMWNLVGIVRSNKRLRLAKRRVELIREDIQEYYWNYQVTSDLIEVRNIVDVADLIICSALQRKESRGLHWNSDYPNQNPAECHDTILKRPDTL